MEGMGCVGLRPVRTIPELGKEEVDEMEEDDEEVRVDDSVLTCFTPFAFGFVVVCWCEVLPAFRDTLG